MTAGQSQNDVTALPRRVSHRRTWLRDLAPRGGPRRRRRARPAHPAERITALLLGAFVLLYLVMWVARNQEVHFDPTKHEDDVQTIWVAFHPYGDPPLLTNDPITRAMSATIPPAFWILGRAAVAGSSVQTAPKILQWAAILIMLAAPVVLWRARRGGLAAAAILLFFLLHDYYVLDRISGGLPRAFAFPAIALWIAGAGARSERLRWIGILLMALIYPQVWVLLVAAEGFLTLFRGVDRQWRPRWGAWERYGALIVLSLAVILPFRVMIGEVGRTHTMAEATANRAFYHEGRLKVLPLPAPAHVFARSFVQPLSTPDPRYVENGVEVESLRRSIGPLVLLGVLGLGVLMGVTPLSRETLAMTLGAFAAYVLAVLLAFRLQNPNRAHEFGMRAACMVMLTLAFGRAWLRVGSPHLRNTLRNGLALAFMIAVVLTTRFGWIYASSKLVHEQLHAGLYACLRSLPDDIRLANHPGDAVSVPFFTGRATMDHFETLQPWIVEQWAEFLPRTKDTLRALYATDPRALLDYAERYGVTHLLLNPLRYGQNWRQRALIFEPLNTFVTSITTGIRREDLAVLQIPAEAVTYRDATWLLVDVARLREIWTPQPTNEALQR